MTSPGMAYRCSAPKFADKNAKAFGPASPTVFEMVIEDERMRLLLACQKMNGSGSAIISI